MSDVADRTVLVAGAAGVIGTYAAAEYRRHGAGVLGVSRRAVPDAPYEHLRVDLSDPAAARIGLRVAKDVTHLVFGAYLERPTLAEQVTANVALLRNTLDGLAAAGAPLRHVMLPQGMKAYGAHLGYMKTPAKETDPRLLGPNFYYAQEDLLRAVATERGFAVTMLRPEAVIGYATGNPMNLLMVIAVYASVCRGLGLPLRFPGGFAAYNCLYQVTDAELLARATVWSGGEPAADGEIFNVTNTDQVRWKHLFPLFAEYFDLDLAEPQPIDLVEHMAAQEAVWRRLEERHHLVRTPWNQLVGWAFGDAIFNSGFDNVSSTVKIRQAGFQDSYDTEDRFVRLFDGLIENKIIPPIG
jgi:nucleoside-diphosphate-sugar epimerase